MRFLSNRKYFVTQRNGIFRDREEDVKREVDEKRVLFGRNS
jgi:hypothetical protein